MELLYLIRSFFHQSASFAAVFKKYIACAPHTKTPAYTARMRSSSQLTEATQKRQKFEKNKNCSHYFQYYPIINMECDSQSTVCSLHAIVFHRTINFCRYTFTIQPYARWLTHITADFVHRAQNAARHMLARIYSGAHKMRCIMRPKFK